MIEFLIALLHSIFKIIFSDRTDIILTLMALKIDYSWYGLKVNKAIVRAAVKPAVFLPKNTDFPLVRIP